MSDAYWRYGDARPPHPSALAPIVGKRSRSDYDSTELTGYYAHEEDRGAILGIRDTVSINASYDRYLRSSQMSSYGNGQFVRSVTGIPVGDPHVVGMGTVDPGANGKDRPMGFGGGRAELPLPPDATVICGPRRIFGDLGEYGAVNWFFLGGAVAPLLVWIASKVFPQHKWIRLIHMPVLLGATSMMPPASAVNFTSWLIMAFIFGYVLYKHRRDWWKRCNYVLSGGLDAGTAFMTILIFLALGSNYISLDWWGNRGEGCPVAGCPTARGVVIDGCPAVL